MFFPCQFKNDPSIIYVLMKIKAFLTTDFYTAERDALESLKENYQRQTDSSFEIWNIGNPNDTSFPKELSKDNSGDCLYLTDSEPLGKKLLKKGHPVLGILHSQNRTSSFQDFPYLAENLSDLPFDTFIKTYQRFKKLPWHILDTERMTLRETVESDIDRFYEIYADRNNARFMEPLYDNPEEEIAYFRMYRDQVYRFYGFGMWTITDKVSKEVIGRAGLNVREGYDSPELGFILDTNYQHLGRGREICRAILKYAFEELDFHSVHAFVHPQNSASVHLLENLGFHLVKGLTLAIMEQPHLYYICNYSDVYK